MLLDVLVLCVSLSGAQPSASVVTTPSYTNPLPNVSLPPAWEERLVYYRSFDRKDAKPEVDGLGASQRARVAWAADGLRGGCVVTGAGRELMLTSPKLSPHKPLTLSFWWALEKDLPIDGGFSLFHLSGGRRYVSLFSRGKGKWCALKEPTGVFQVYNFPGVKNVSALYDRRLSRRLDLKRGAWHHTAATFSVGRHLIVYTDGRPVLRGVPPGPLAGARRQGRFPASGRLARRRRAYRRTGHPRRNLGPRRNPRLPRRIRQMHQADYPVR